MKKTILKKAVPFFVLGAMVTGIFGSTMAYATSEPANGDSACSSSDATEFSVPLYDRLDADKINASDKLSADQKAKLIKANDEAKAYFDQVDSLLDANDKKYDEFMAGTESVYEKIDGITSQHSDLWGKFEEMELTDADEDKTEEELIKGSSALSEEEKSVLLSDLKQIEKYDAQLDAKNDAFYEATKDTDAKFDEAYKTIEKIFADNGVSLDQLSDELVTPTDSTD